MTRTRFASAAVLLAALLGSAVAKDKPATAPPPRPLFQPVSYPDVSGFRGVKDAIAADAKEFSQSMPKTLVPAGYLGLVFADKNGHTVIAAVEPESPADKAGCKPGDVVQTLDEKPCPSANFARDTLRTKLSGTKLSLTVQRNGEPVVLSATLKPTSSPILPITAAAAARPVIGAMLEAPAAGSGIRVSDVTGKGPAETAGVKVGDVILKINGADVTDVRQFRNLIGERKVGDQVELLVERDGKRIDLKPILGADTAADGPAGANRLGSAWRKPTYNLAIIGVEYSDVKHDPRIGDADWAESMFSTRTYHEKSVTGQKVYGSMNDYYRDLSFGKFHVEGKFLGWADLPKKRMDYSSNNGGDPKEKAEFFNGALDRCLEKFGKTSLDGYDGVFFVYAGGRVSTTRGGLYWPHRSSLSHKGKRWSYFIVNELAGGRMNDISVFCHEFGHMLGLPDLYARQENPGDEGVGEWCAMSQQGQNGRPQHFSAWCKEQLGWIAPTVLDPRVQQKLVLAPIEDDPTQCFKVMVRPDGSEYFLLENRKKKGWDDSLPAEGLLIWRVVKRTGGDFRQLGAQPVFLEEAHGIEGSSGPNVELKSVPFPSPQNDSFTPFTTPSSRGQLGGGLPVYISNIRRLPDGRITFHIGYEYQ